MRAQNRLSNFMIRKGPWLCLAVIAFAVPVRDQSGTFQRHEISISARWENRNDCVAGAYVTNDGSVTSTSTSPSATVQIPSLNCPGQRGITITGSVNIVMPATIPPFATIAKTPITVSLTVAGNFAGTDSSTAQKWGEANAGVPYGVGGPVPEIVGQTG